METIVVAIIGSGVLSVLISGIFDLIKQKRAEKKATASIDHRLDKNEKDIVRLQLLVLISLFPDDESEIMEVARHYFSDLGGNWYMTTIFNKWLEKTNTGKPEWFKGKKGEK